MEIINKDDPRYKLLPFIWEKYKFEDIFDEGEGIKPKNKIFIVPELVMDDYITNKIYITNKVGGWVARDKERILLESTWLTEEQYYLIMVRHINDTDDVPKCACRNCRKPLQYNYRFNIGYYTYCDHSCKSSEELMYQHENPDEYPNRANHTKEWSAKGREVSNFADLWDDPDWRESMIDMLSERHKDPLFRTKFDMMKFICIGDSNDTCYLYATVTDTNIKFGITQDIETRKFLGNISEESYTGELHQLYSDNRINIAYLEAILKLKFKGREFIEYNESSLLFKYLKDTLKQGIINPFED